MGPEETNAYRILAALVECCEELMPLRAFRKHSDAIVFSTFYGQAKNFVEDSVPLRQREEAHAVLMERRHAEHFRDAQDPA